MFVVPAQMLLKLGIVSVALMRNLALLGGEGYILQHRLAAVIGKAHMVKGNVVPLGGKGKYPHWPEGRHGRGSDGGGKSGHVR